MLVQGVSLVKIYGHYMGIIKTTTSVFNLQHNELNKEGKKEEEKSVGS